MLVRPRRAALPRSRDLLLTVVACTGFTLAGPQQRPVLPHDLAPPAPAVALTPPVNEHAREDRCVACHADVATEWASTAHAVAWLDTVYIEALKEKKKPETCWGCHAPRPLLAGELGAKPPAREAQRELGITCESCHVDAAGTVLGPRGTPTTAHASKLSDVFVAQRSNALCASCHRFNIGPVVGVAKDFEQAQMAERGLSCVGCHTAEVEMRFANAVEGSAGGAEIPLRKGRSHAIQTPRDPAFLRRAFELSLRREGAGSVVTVRNAAGHRVPGLIGRWIEIEGQALDAEGRPIRSGKLRLDASAYLPVDGALDIALAATGMEVRVIGRCQDPRGDEPFTFLDVRLPAQAR